MAKFKNSMATRDNTQLAMCSNGSNKNHISIASSGFVFIAIHPCQQFPTQI